MTQCTPNQFVFASLYTRDREPLLRSRETKELLLAKMMDTKLQFRLNIAGYVVLNDHMHWLFSSPPGNECSAIVNHLRGGMQRDWRARQIQGGDLQIWEHGSNISLVVGKEALRNHLDFIHYDPVRHGLIAHAVDYPWSSLPTRVAEGHYPEDWGRLAPPAGVAKVVAPLAEVA